MAKPGRPRIIRKAEEAKDIPIEQSIQVEIPPEGTVEIPDPKKVAGQEQEKVEPKVEPKVEGRDEEKTSLLAQLEAAKKAEEAAKKQVAEVQAREIEARKQLEESNKKSESAFSRANQAEYDAVLNAISAATVEADSAERELQAAGENQDWGAIAKAQAKLARAQTRLVQLEDGKIALEERAKRLDAEAKQRKEQPQQQVIGDPVENYVDSLQGLLPSQRTWLKEHRELLTDATKNRKMQIAHLTAEENGLRIGGEEYFQFLEEKLGYRKPKIEDEMVEDDDKAAIVSAPVSREEPALSNSRPTRITLSSEERSHAAASGVSEVEYAKQKLKLIEAKKAGRYEH